MSDWIDLEYEIKKDFSQAGNASSNLKKVLKSIGIYPALVRRASIASFEAEVNVIAHAEGGMMNVRITTEKLTVVIKDFGPGIPDVGEAMKPGYSTASELVRSMGFGAGMGLPNIRNNVDDLNISSELGVGTILTFSIFFDKENSIEDA